MRMAAQEILAASTIFYFQQGLERAFEHSH